MLRVLFVMSMVGLVACGDESCEGEATACDGETTLVQCVDGVVEVVEECDEYCEDTMGPAHCHVEGMEM